MQIRLIYFGVLLLAFSGLLVTTFRRAPGRTLQGLAIWVLLFVALIAAHGLWPDLRRALLPRAALSVAGGVELRAADDGHFYADATIDGAALTLLIDTGASDIVLTPADARRIGLDTGALDYTGRASTANGTVATAPVTLASLTLGPWQDHDLPASVAGDGLDRSLLGMSYLSRFRITLDGDRMRLSR